MSAKRFSWLVPRYSIANLLMLMVVVGIALAWYVERRKVGEQADTIERQRLAITRLAVSNIMRSQMTDEQKAKALEPFIKVGDDAKEIERWCVGANEAGMVLPKRAGYYSDEFEVKCVNGKVSDFGYCGGFFISLAGKNESEE